MDQIIKELAAIANDLDSKGLSKLADAVDEIADTALDIKVAQYVGIQGYWVRNSRCWGNCLRQKKTSSPEKPSQEIWAACHKEYLESLGNPDSTWDKYAGSSEGFIKSASARDEFHKGFKAKIESKVAAGADLRSAIVASMDEQGSENFGRLIEASNALVKMADELSENDLDTSLRLANAASSLSKVARWWHPADWMGGIGDWASRNRADYANRLQQKAQDYMSREQGRNNPFLGGGSTPPPAPAGGPGGPGAGGGFGGGAPMPPPISRARKNEVITGPGMAGGNFKPDAPMLGGDSMFDKDGNPVAPPTPAGGAAPGTASPGGPAGGGFGGAPEFGPDGQITLRPMSALDEMSPAEAARYFKTLLKAQERINAQLSAMRTMYSPSYRKDRGWGDDPVAPPAPGAPAAPAPASPPAPAPGGAAPAGGPPKPPIIPPAPPAASGLPPGFIGGPAGGNVGQPVGPTGGFGTPSWTSNTPKPKRRVAVPPTGTEVTPVGPTSL